MRFFLPHAVHHNLNGILLKWSIPEFMPNHPHCSGFLADKSTWVQNFEKCGIRDLKVDQPIFPHNKTKSHFYCFLVFYCIYYVHDGQGWQWTPTTGQTIEILTVSCPYKCGGLEQPILNIHNASHFIFFNFQYSFSNCWL